MVARPPCLGHESPGETTHSLRETMFGSPIRWRVLVSLAAISCVAACDSRQSPTAPAATPGLSLATVGFSSTGDLVAARSDHIAVRLLDGRILVAGRRSRPHPRRR